MRAALFLALCLALSGVAVQGNRPAVAERNGWGAWADFAVGRGSRPRPGEHPLQSYIETMMRGLGNRVMRAEVPAWAQLAQNETLNGTLDTSSSGVAGPASAANATVGGAGNGTDAGAGANGTDAAAEEGAEEQDEEGELIPVSYGSSVRIPADTFQRGVDEWIGSHPERIREAFQAMLWGVLFFVIATGVLVYSEVRTVLLVRELDQLAVAGVTSVPEEVAEREASNDRIRPYLSCGAAGIMLLALLFVLTNVCMLATEILESLGYAFEGCVVMVACGALVLTAQWCLFIIGICWVCTRPYTGALLIAVSLIGELSVEKEEPVAVLLWALFAGTLIYLWLRFGKHLVSEAPEADPEKKRLVSD